MYCKFKDGDLVMVKRDTKSYNGACVRKWIYGTVLKCFAADGRYNGYVRILLGKDNFTLIQIKDLKKISIKNIPKGSYSTPKFNNGDYVFYKGETRYLYIEGWVVDNKPYYNKCKIVIKTVSGNHMIVDECDTCKFDDCRFDNSRYFDTEMIPKHLLNSVYGMTSRKFEDCVNDVVVMMNLKKQEQKLKEVSNMLNDGRIVQFKREGNTITATLYDTKEISDCCKTSREIISASAKCHPDDRFDLDLGMHIAFTRLSGKWKLINKKSNLQKFKDGEIYVRVTKNSYCNFMCMLHENDIWFENQDLFLKSAQINNEMVFGVFNGSVQFMTGPCSAVRNIIAFSELLK